MIAWNPEQYLRFGSERTRPSRDLASAVPLEAPGTILDAGCGPGNSTAVLKEFWPHARIQGVEDVYKRQSEGIENRLADAARQAGSLQELYGSVSYTHLDVYKRQGRGTGVPWRPARVPHNPQAALQ